MTIILTINLNHNQSIIIVSTKPNKKIDLELTKFLRGGELKRLVVHLLFRSLIDV